VSCSFSRCKDYHIKKDEMDKVCSKHGKVRDVYNKILVGKPEGKRPLGRPWHRWDDDITVVKEQRQEGMDWIDLALNRDRWWAHECVISGFTMTSVNVIIFWDVAPHSSTSVSLYKTIDLRHRSHLHTRCRENLIISHGDLRGCSRRIIKVLISE
jgi:hypothetical protein